MYSCCGNLCNAGGHGRRKARAWFLLGGELTFYWHGFSMAEQMMFHKHKTVTHNSRAMNKTENEKDLPFEKFLLFPADKLHSSARGVPRGGESYGLQFA